MLCITITSANIKNGSRKKELKTEYVLSVGGTKKK